MMSVRMPQGTMSASIAIRIMRTQAINKSVPVEGVIGYDFYTNFTLAGWERLPLKEKLASLRGGSC